MEGAKPVLELVDVSCGYGERAVLSHLDCRVLPGERFVILGPNGIGKTTLFKTMLGFLAPLAGSVRIAGRETGSWARKDFAREVAYLPQNHTPSFSFSVRDMVLMGRTPHVQGLGAPTSADEAIVDEVLAGLGLASLAGRDYSALSGGERQMVLIARCLAQQPRVLVMDEPCASLDYGNQASLLKRVMELCGNGIAVVMTTHDPNHAVFLDGTVLCIAGDGDYACGPIREVMTSQRLSSLYRVPVSVDEVERKGTGRTITCAPVIAFESGDAIWK